MSDYPSLTGTRIQLKPFDKQDDRLFYLINTDVFVRQYLWDDRVISMEDAEDIIEQNDKQFQNEKSGLWKIFLKETEEVIGYCGLWYFFNEPQPQLLYVLQESHTGLGYATEASRLVIQYAFNELGYQYLLAATDSDNIPSQRLAERLSMTLSQKKVINHKPTLFYRLVNPRSMKA